MDPTELNETSEDILMGLVQASVDGLNGQTPDVQPLAPFITLQLLHRLHELIVQLLNSGRCKLAKHKLLGAAVLRATGTPVPPDVRDVDKIGNHLDIWLKRRYVDEDKKLQRRTCAVREEARAKLRLECCIVTNWGGVQRHCFEPTASLASRTAAPHVPYTCSMAPPQLTLLDLAEQVNRAREEAATHASSFEREKERSLTAKRKLADTMVKVARVRKRAAVARREKVELATQTQEVMQEKERVQAERDRTEKELQNEKARAAAAEAERLRIERSVAVLERSVAKERQVGAATLMRLGGQAARAVQEAGVYAERAEQERQKRMLLLARSSAEKQSYSGLKLWRWRPST